MNSDIDGRGRYDVCGIQAEDVISEVMERVYERTDSAMAAWDVANALKYLLRLGRKDGLETELGKAENYLHHARTGKWIGEENDDEH